MSRAPPNQNHSGCLLSVLSRGPHPRSIILEYIKEKLRNAHDKKFPGTSYEMWLLKSSPPPPLLTTRFLPERCWRPLRGVSCLGWPEGYSLSLLRVPSVIVVGIVFSWDRDRWVFPRSYWEALPFWPEGWHRSCVNYSGSYGDSKGIHQHGVAYRAFLIFSPHSVSFRNILFFCIIWLTLALRKLRGIGDWNEGILQILQISLWKYPTFMVLGWLM